VLIASIWLFAQVKPMVDSDPGGGLLVFWIALAVFAAISAWAIWGSDRGTADGASEAILDLRLAFATRVAIHLLFLGALLWLGLAVSEPILLVVAVALLLAELPLASLVRARA
jgi:hypothetical protein